VWVAGGWARDGEADNEGDEMREPEENEEFEDPEEKEKLVKGLGLSAELLVFSETWN
jgi:hypothetical protein